MRRGASALPLLVASLALVALTAAVYGPVAGHDFVDYDDYVSIVRNPHHAAPLSWQSIRSALTWPYDMNWIPLTSLSLQVDAALWGARAGPTLLLNVGLHTAAALLLWVALARLTGARWRSGFVAAVFAVHPLHVESVAWASQRKDVLSGVFFALTLLAYARWRQRQGPGRYAALVLALTLGLLAKPTLVTLPFVLLLLDAWPLARLRDEAGRLDPRRLGAAVVEKLPLFALAASVAAITWVVQSALGARESLADLSLSARLANACIAYVAYLRSAFWPADLIVAYPHPGEDVSWRAAGACAVALAGATLAAWRARRRAPYLLVGWLWFLGMLVPMLGLVQVGVQARADRYTYLALTGIAIALAWGVHDLAGAFRSRVPRSVLAPLALVAIAALAGVARAQVHHWRNTVSLFEHAVSVAPDHAVARHRLGVAYVEAGDLASAERHYEALLRLEPHAVRPRFEWANALDRAGQTDRALRHYARAVELEPGYARGRGLYALALLRAGRPEQALPHFEAALEQHAGVSDLHRGAARALFALGRHAEAIEQRRAWVRTARDSVAARNELAWALATCPDPELRAPGEAVALVEPLVARQPGRANLLDTLAAAYAADGRFEDAIRTAEQAVRAAREGATRARFAARLARYRRGEIFVDRPGPPDPRRDRYIERR